MTSPHQDTTTPVRVIPLYRRGQSFLRAAWAMFMVLGVFVGSAICANALERGWLHREQEDLYWFVGAIIIGSAGSLGTLAYLVQRLIRARVERWSLRWERAGMSLVSSKRAAKWAHPQTSLGVTLGSYYGTGTEHQSVHLITLCIAGPSGPLLVLGCDYAMVPGGVSVRSGPGEPDYGIVPRDFLDLLRTFAPDKPELRAHLESFVAKGLGASLPLR